MKRFHWLLSLALIGVALIVWFSAREPWPAWLGGEAVVTVGVAPVKKRTIPLTARVSGVLVPSKEVVVVSRLAGRITEMRFKVGDPVPAGAVVAVIFPREIAERERDLEAGLSAAQADLQEKERRLADANTLADRSRELFNRALIARRDAEQAELAAETARSQTELARAQLAQQEALLAQARKIQRLAQITAPVSGVIARRLVEPGALIAEASPILTITNENTLKFTGRVAAELSGDLRAGLSAKITSGGLPGKSLDGILSRLVPGSDNGAEFSEVEIQIQIDGAPNMARSTMEANALITLDRATEMLLVPRTAIVESAGKFHLFKFINNRAVYQEVKVAATAGDEVAIEQGVGESDVVIVENLRSLNPGSRVRASGTNR